MAGFGSWGVFLACAFAAEIIGTMAGFGSATILTPIAVFFMDIKTAIAVVACFHLFGNASRLFFFGRHIEWKIWAEFGLVSFVCTLVGATLTATLSSAIVKGAFGLFLLLFVVSSCLPASSVRLPNSPPTLIGGGMLSGFIAGLIGTGGAIRSACLLVFGLSKEAYIGTSAAIALLVDATRLPVYLTRQLIPARLLTVVISLIVVAFAGSRVGQWLLRYVSTSVFQRFVLGMLTLMGLKLLWDEWHGLV